MLPSVLAIAPPFGHYTFLPASWTGLLLKSCTRYSRLAQKSSQPTRHKFSKSPHNDCSAWNPTHSRLPGNPGVPNPFLPSPETRRLYSHLLWDQPPIYTVIYIGMLPADIILLSNSNRYVVSPFLSGARTLPGKVNDAMMANIQNPTQVMLVVPTVERVPWRWPTITHFGRKKEYFPPLVCDWCRCSSHLSLSMWLVTCWL